MIEWATVNCAAEPWGDGNSRRTKRAGPRLWQISKSHTQGFGYHPLGYGDPFKNFEQGSDKIRKDQVHMGTREDSDYSQVYQNPGGYFNCLGRDVEVLNKSSVAGRGE